MTGPFIFIATNKLKQGKLEAMTTAQRLQSCKSILIRTRSTPQRASRFSGRPPRPSWRGAYLFTRGRAPCAMVGQRPGGCR